MKKIVLFFFLFFITLFVFYYFLNHGHSLVSPLGKGTPKEYSLLAYTFENLQKTKFPESQLRLGHKVSQASDVTSQMFYFSVPETPNSTAKKIVSGLLNLPRQPGSYPVIVMIRGFVPQETYQPGSGTQPVARVLAQHGFITLAPDFLGYGASASPSADPFEERFQTYTTALTLLSSLPTLNTGLEASYSGTIKANLKKIGLWGHSNGGQIGLSILAISGALYPTVLWAPVSKSFPYSILYYTDETDDQGKYLRSALADFEKDYDTEKFSPTNYYQWIKAPVEIHQGEADHEVPIWWSSDLVTMLKKKNIEVKYFTYSGADHNLLPDGWSSAVSNSITFYNDYFKTRE